jgi:hypothetical protein
LLILSELICFFGMASSRLKLARPPSVPAIAKKI